MGAMAKRQARSGKTGIKASVAAGSGSQRGTGDHAPGQRDAEDQAPAAGAVHGELPVRQAPQLCQLAESPPAGSDWISEIKFDGYRLLAFLAGGKVRILSRNGLDWTSRLPSLLHAIAQLKVDAAILDGELVALEANGASSFADLQRALSESHESRLFYCAFDLLYLNGWDLRPCALVHRKKLLAALSDWKGMLRYSDHLVGETVELYRQACATGLEGIVCKRANAPYRSGRSSSWLKVKCRNREEFVVLGWTPPQGHRNGLGALHVGYYGSNGDLHYAGGVGTGFNTRELLMLRAQLDRIPATGSQRVLYAGDPIDRTIRWVRPQMVIEVEYAGWSGSGRLRHSVFLGIREDKPATEVVREIADPRAARTPLKPPARGIDRAG
jgi:bifunctional non-homologous end joining protein LigD